MASEERIQQDIIDRVLALDGNQTAVSIRASEAEATVEALAELTTLDRADIDAVARQVRLEHDARLTFAQRVRNFLEDSGYKVLGAMLASFVVIAIFSYTARNTITSTVVVGNTTPPMHAAHSTSQHDYVKAAELAQVLNSVSFLRAAAMQYYLETGAFARSIDELGFASREMTDGEYIDAVNINADGVIIATLSDRFGDGQHLALVPRVVMGGTQVKWACETTLGATVVALISSCESKTARAL